MPLYHRCLVAKNSLREGYRSLSEVYRSVREAYGKCKGGLQECMVPYRLGEGEIVNYLIESEVMS